jgi:predicted  nucleic acid-binding Zn-ribbon protein
MKMRELIIVLSDEEYNNLVERAKKDGFILLNEYIKYLLLGYGEKNSKPQIDTSMIINRIERKVQDILIPFTSEIDTLKKQIAMVYEKLDEILPTQEARDLSHEKKLEPQKKSKEVEETKQSEKAIEKEKLQPQKETKEVKERKNEITPSEKGIEKKKDAMGVLKEQGVVSESELSLRNPDAFFSKLESEGAKIIMTEKERIAIHPDFYTKFVNDLSKVNIADVNEAMKRLNEKEAKLFKKLVSEGLAFFDNESKAWKVLV